MAPGTPRELTGDSLKLRKPLNRGPGLIYPVEDKTVRTLLGHGLYWLRTRAHKFQILLPSGVTHVRFSVSVDVGARLEADLKRARNC